MAEQVGDSEHEERDNEEDAGPRSIEEGVNMIHFQRIDLKRERCLI